MVWLDDMDKTLLNNNILSMFVWCVQSPARIKGTVLDYSCSQFSNFN